jgi:uncharacterized protein (DUF342 family)
MVARILLNSKNQALLAETRHKQYKEKFSLHEVDIKNQKAALQELETQVGKIAKILSERPQGSLPSNKEPNPKVNLSAVTLRNSSLP